MLEKKNNFVIFVGVLTCDEMTCPSNSVKCSVSKKTTSDLNNIETVRKCYDSNGELYVLSAAKFSIK